MHKERVKSPASIPFILVGIVVFVLLGNARSATPHPFIPGAILTMNLFVPVVAGRIKGWREGLVIGLVGSVLNFYSPAGTIFDLLGAVPYGLSGAIAGFLKDRFPTPFVALSLVVGRILSIIAFYWYGLVSAAIFLNPAVWVSLFFIMYIGVVMVMFTYTVYRLIWGYRVRT